MKTFPSHASFVLKLVFVTRMNALLDMLGDKLQLHQDVRLMALGDQYSIIRATPPHSLCISGSILNRPVSECPDRKTAEKA